MLSVDLKYIPIKTPASRRASSSLSERWFGWRSSAFLQPEWGPLTLFLLKGGGDGPLPHGVGSEPLGPVTRGDCLEQETVAFGVAYLTPHLRQRYTALCLFPLNKILTHS